MLVEQLTTPQGDDTHHENLNPLVCRWNTGQNPWCGFCMLKAHVELVNNAVGSDSARDERHTKGWRMLEVLCVESLELLSPRAASERRDVCDMRSLMRCVTVYRLRVIRTEEFAWQSTSETLSLISSSARGLLCVFVSKRISASTGLPNARRAAAKLRLHASSAATRLYSSISCSAKPGSAL